MEDSTLEGNFTVSDSGMKVEYQRAPKCTLCRNHGFIVPKKGHRSCRFLGCPCQKCTVITRRRRAVAYRKSFNKVRNDVKKPGGVGVVDQTANRPLAEVTVASAAPGSAGASRSATDGGGKPYPGLESSDQPPQARNFSGFELEQTSPLPLIPYPFVESNICPQRVAVRGQYFPNMSWLPPPPPPPAGWRPVVHYTAQTPLAYTNNYSQYYFGLPPFPQPGTLRRSLPTRQQWPLLTRRQPQLLPQNNQQASGK